MEATEAKALVLLILCRFLTDLPRGLDTFNNVCMAQQSDSSVLEDNKKHVASIVQVQILMLSSSISVTCSVQVVSMSLDCMTLHIGWCSSVTRPDRGSPP